MMYTTIRQWYKYGREGDAVEVTWKEHQTIEKAIAYTHRYSTGLKFVSCQIEDEKGNELYELLANGDVYDYRQSEQVEIDYPTTLKTVLDLYDQEQSTLMDIAIVMTEECGLSDPAQGKRARDIIARDCKTTEPNWGNKNAVTFINRSIREITLEGHLIGQICVETTRKEFDSMESAFVMYDRLKISRSNGKSYEQCKRILMSDNGGGLMNLKTRIEKAKTIMLECVKIKPINSVEYDVKRIEASRALKKAYSHHSDDVCRRICRITNAIIAKALRSECNG